MELSSPLFVFRVPGRLIWVLAVVWLAGFAGVFLFKVVSHLRFRAWLLKGVRDPLPRTMDVWYEELNRANIVNPKFCLGIAPNVKTPLTVGLIPCATWVLLPDRPYSEEELRLILRHEIVHICRGDVWSKFFLVFCAAMCWFNPLMWIAARKSADDLELSCDETVLAGEDSGSRRRYAELILKNGRGRTGIYHLSLGDGDGSALPAEKYRESGKKAFRRGYGGGSVRSAFHELRVCGVCL